MRLSLLLQTAPLRIPHLRLLMLINLLHHQIIKIRMNHQEIQLHQLNNQQMDQHLLLMTPNHQIQTNLHPPLMNRKPNQIAQPPTLTTQSLIPKLVKRLPLMPLRRIPLKMVMIHRAQLLLRPPLRRTRLNPLPLLKMKSLLKNQIQILLVQVTKRLRPLLLGKLEKRKLLILVTRLNLLIPLRLTQLSKLQIKRTLSLLILPRLTHQPSRLSLIKKLIKLLNLTTPNKIQPLKIRLMVTIDLNNPFPLIKTPLSLLLIALRKLKMVRPLKTLRPLLQAPKLSMKIA